MKHGRVGRSKIEEHQNFRKVWRDHWSLQQLAAFTLNITYLELISGFPVGCKKTGSVWVEHDAGGETSQTAARDVTLQTTSQNFFGWIEKGFGLHNMMHAPQASCQLASTLLFWKDFKVFFFCVCTFTSNSLSNLGPHAFQSGWKDLPYDIH